MNPTQLQQVLLREQDPVEWLRDKMVRRVAIDLRGQGNRLAVEEVLRLADLARNGRVGSQ